MAKRFRGIFDFAIAILVIAALTAATVPSARAFEALPPDVVDVLNRLDQANCVVGHTAGILSDADRAPLFKHNDAGLQTTTIAT